MIIAFALNKPDRQSAISIQFGHCNYIMLYNSETGVYSFFENQEIKKAQDVGLSLASLLKKENVNLVAAGRFGNKTASFFARYNIQMVLTNSNQTPANIIHCIKQ